MMLLHPTPPSMKTARLARVDAGIRYAIQINGNSDMRYLVDKGIPPIHIPKPRHNRHVQAPTRMNTHDAHTHTHTVQTQNTRGDSVPATCLLALQTFHTLKVSTPGATESWVSKGEPVTTAERRPGYNRVNTL